MKQFNIGIQAAFKPRSFELQIGPDTLEGVARLGARVVVTVYAAQAPTADHTTSAEEASEPPNKRLKLTAARCQAGRAAAA